MEIETWAWKPIERALKTIHSTHTLLHLCMDGLNLVSKFPIIAEINEEIQQHIETTSLEAEEHLTIDQSKNRAAMALQEIESDFALLHANSLVTLWSSLDSLIDDIIIAWIENNHDIIKGPSFEKIKISISDYESMNNIERMSFLLRELSRSVNADIKVGAGKFEKLLEAIGLGGSIDEKLRRDLFEMSQIRNAIVHCGGTVDQILKNNCPWIKWQVLETIKLNHNDYIKYYKAVHVYLYIIINRIRVHFHMSQADWSLEEWEKRGICP